MVNKTAMRLVESSLNDLYRSAVAAFPATRMRQHATNPIIIEEIRWTPFVGLGTLLVRGSARNETRHYEPLILFKGVRYGRPGVDLVASDGLPYQFATLSAESTQVLVRCPCADFNWRFNYTDHLDRSLYGRKRTKYEGHGGPPANPLNLPGMCKHLIKLSLAMKDAGLFTEMV